MWRCAMSPDVAKDQAASRVLGPAGLITVRERPFNAESPLAQQLGAITPTERFYVRSHFGLEQAPRVDGWRLEVGGAVRQPLSLSIGDLLALPARSLVGTMECAGNGRRF